MKCSWTFRKLGKIDKKLKILKQLRKSHQFLLFTHYIYSTNKKFSFLDNIYLVNNINSEN